MSQTLEQMQSGVGTTMEPARPAKETSAEKLIAADAVRRERERLAKRAEIRAQIKERGALTLQMADTAEQLRLLDQRADEAAADHQERTAPIQQKLQSAAGDKRSKLLAELTEANVSLERELDAIGRTRAPLTKQHRDLRTEAAGLPTEGALAHLGSPSLLCEMFAARKRFEHAMARLEVANDQLSFLEPQLDAARTTKSPVSEFGWGKPHQAPAVNLEAAAHLTRRVRDWKTELVHASAEHDAAVAAIDELTRDLIDE